MWKGGALGPLPYVRGSGKGSAPTTPGSVIGRIAWPPQEVQVSQDI